MEANTNARVVGNEWLPPNDDANVHGYWVPSPDEIMQRKAFLKANPLEPRSRRQVTKTANGALQRKEREVLAALLLMDRPATINEICDRFGIGKLRCQKALQSLKATGLVFSVKPSKYVAPKDAKEALYRGQ